MKQEYVYPSFKAAAFTCPKCKAYSKQDWATQTVNETRGQFYGRTLNKGSEIVNYLYLCKCQCCGYVSFWYKEKLIWPMATTVEEPIEEMPDDIKRLYDEAASILELSPKGSCAILRLALQKLCNRLANQEESKKIDGAIKKLVENGLSSKIQQAMDIVRIIGDEAVHPGEIDIDDNKEIAITMFSLINFIVEKMIVEPEEINKLYSQMPEKKIKGIENRDKTIHKE